jgi:alanine racemase
MDQLLIDVTAISDAEVGECVTLLGEDGSERVTAEDLAEWAGTIPYEILCRISGRVSREYRP